ncbi:isocitrate lyase/phosphoenolpyruvate mutase family protein [Streptomyces sp. NPDC052236]|uniref:isocitrate lyase/phosphoenolpyruvate mutase family protein n=1 Tax=Streptomyces sp. NPDC052236 TaxID=3365686 RepID=UPI0037D6127F
MRPPLGDERPCAGRGAALHHGDGPLLLPNAWDVSSAAALAAAGFTAVGTTSLGVAAAHGLPDGRGLAREETVALARRLGRSALPCPYTVDIEGGFGGGSDEVGALVQELARAGAAGVNLEDGLPGGGLRAVDRQVELVRAVKQSAPALYLNARIDTHWMTDAPPPLSSALRRAEAYLEAGADGIFVPGIVDGNDIEALVAAIPAPLNILYTPEAHTVPRLASLGVRRVSTGSLLYRGALGAAVAMAEAVRAGREVPTAGVPGYAEVQEPAADGVGEDVTSAK